MNRHDEWIASIRPSLLEGDQDAIDAIRGQTFAALGLPTDPEAPVYLWNGIWVKGEGESSHPVSDAVRARFVTTPPPPGQPRAVWPASVPRPGREGSEREAPGPSRRERLLDLSLGRVEGDADAIAELVQKVRRHHEVVPDMFPKEIELHWFETGIMLVGPGESPVVYQAPMHQLGEMVVAREYPTLPYVRMARRRI